MYLQLRLVSKSFQTWSDEADCEVNYVFENKFVPDEDDEMGDEDDDEMDEDEEDDDEMEEIDDDDDEEEVDDDVIEEVDAFNQRNNQPTTAKRPPGVVTLGKSLQNVTSI